MITDVLATGPARTRQALRFHETFMALCGGALAWFVPLNAPHWFPEWRWNSMIAVMVVSCLFALLATLICWRACARIENGAAGDRRLALENVSRRARFLALLGALLGAAAALSGATSAIAFFVLPKWAG